MPGKPSVKREAVVDSRSCTSLRPHSEWDKDTEMGKTGRVAVLHGGNRDYVVEELEVSNLGMGECLKGCHSLFSARRVTGCRAGIRAPAQ